MRYFVIRYRRRVAKKKSGHFIAGLIATTNFLPSNSAMKAFENELSPRKKNENEASNENWSHLKETMRR